MHRCSDDEFAKFYPFEAASANKAKGFQEKKLLWCMDPAHLISLKGSWRTDDNFGAIEPSVFACASEVQLYDGSV